MALSHSYRKTVLFRQWEIRYLAHGTAQGITDAMTIPPTETLLDLRGLACPMPVLKANRALRDMAPGTRLRILATDRASVADFQSYCRETGHAMVAFTESAGVLSFVIRRRAETQPS